MTDENTGISEDAKPVERAENEARQRRRMRLALALLLVAFTMVLIKEWDFWFPPSPVTEADAGDQESPVTTGQPSTIPAQKRNSTVSRAKKHKVAATTGPAAEPKLAPVITNRAVLPPLEVEVVAGDEHRTIRAGTNSVKVDLQPRTPVTSAPSPS